MLRRAIEQTGERAEDLAMLGRTYLVQRGDVSEGLSALARAVERLPGRSDVLRDFVVLSARSGNFAGAFSVLDRALRPGGEADDVRFAERRLAFELSERARVLYEQGAADRARATVVDGIDRLEDEESRVRLRALVARLDELGQQRKEVDRHNRIVGLYNQAIDAANGGRYGEAKRLLDEALALDPPGELGANVREFADDVGRTVRMRELTDRLSEAHRLSKTLEWERALSILEEILRSNPPTRVRNGAETLLDRLEAARQGG